VRPNDSSSARKWLCWDRALLISLNLNLNGSALVTHLRQVLDVVYRMRQCVGPWRTMKWQTHKLLTLSGNG
jgi:hypothetical protein